MLTITKMIMAHISELIFDTFNAVNTIRQWKL